MERISCGTRYMNFHEYPEVLYFRGKNTQKPSCPKVDETSGQRQSELYSRGLDSSRQKAYKMVHIVKLQFSHAKHCEYQKSFVQNSDFWTDFLRFYGINQHMLFLNPFLAFLTSTDKRNNFLKIFTPVARTNLNQIEKYFTQLARFILDSVI